MSNVPQIPAQNEAKRIGILLTDLGKVNVTALKFLLLQLNRQQHTFEYEFLPIPQEDPFTQSFSKQVFVDLDLLDVPAFLSRYRTYLQTENQHYALKASPIDGLILITTARLAGNYIGVQIDGLEVLSFSNWKRSLAPPSILEFILIGVLQASVYSISSRVQASIHLATKGCLFDYTAYLAEARLHVLTSFICHDCRIALQSDGLQKLVEELDHILEKSWLGKSSEPDMPAGIIAKLGADLFVTSGLKPTAWQTIKSTLEQEWVKQLLTLLVTVVGAILIAVLVILLGLKK